MPWVKLDDHFDENPKILSVGPLGLALWVTGIAYSNRNGTDGFIPSSMAIRLISLMFENPKNGQTQTVLIGGERDYEEEEQVGIVPDGYYLPNMLVNAGLWESVPGGYAIHDYHEFQPTKEHVEATREARREAGRAGGVASGIARREASAKQHGSSHEASVKQNGSKTEASDQAREQNGSKTEAKDQAKTNPVPDPDPSASKEAERACARVPAAALEDLEISEADLAVGRLCRSWENATSTTVTAALGEKLSDWLERLPEAAIVKAIAETGAAGARNWRYCEAILRRYQTEGWADKPKGPEPYREPPPPTADQVEEWILNRPERFGVPGAAQ